MNPRLVDMAEDDTIYRSAAPALFGDGFCKKAKERDEELKCLNQATSSGSKAGPTPQSKQGNSFFREAASKKTIPGEAAKTTGDEEVASREASLTSNQPGQGSPTNRKELNLDAHTGNTASSSNVCSFIKKIFAKPYANTGHPKPVTSWHNEHGSKSRNQKHPHSREVTPVHTKLEGHNTGPLGDKQHTGVHNRPGQPTCPISDSQGVVLPQEETRSLTEEVVKMVEKGAISVVSREQKAKGFHSQLFCVPKKDGG